MRSQSQLRNDKYNDENKGDSKWYLTVHRFGANSGEWNDKSHFSKLRQVIFLSASFRGPATTLRLSMPRMIDCVNLSPENNTLHMAPSPQAKFRTLSQSEIAKKNCGTYSLSFYSALK